MPIYKTADEMLAKWRAKYNPTVVSTRFTDVKDVADKRAQAGIPIPDGVRTKIKSTLDSQGLTGGLRATYMAFALKLNKHILRQGGTGATKIKDGLISYFKTAYGLSETILNTIASLIVGS